MARKPKQQKLGQYQHTDKERANIPAAGLVTAASDPDKGEKRRYEYDPHLDPQLQWASKAEHTSFEVDIVSLHAHEKVDPKVIIENLKKEPDASQQSSMFEDHRPLREALEFYQHRDGWSNRMVAGDSLLVMNSLLEKEGMGGNLQMVYFDPPYGITYRSNFQPYTNNTEPTDGKAEDLTTEPEMIKAFSDTWELGIHSYLSYLRDRLRLARELLADSGSAFLQIGRENVHRASMVLDEVFGADNRVATITYATSGSSSTKYLPEVADYLLWYAKDKGKLKFRQIYEPLSRSEVIKFFNRHVGIEDNGTDRPPKPEERYDPAKIPEGARIYKRTDLTSQGVSNTGRSEPYEWDGRLFDCSGRHWSISREGLDRLAKLGRLVASEEQEWLMWKKYEEEVPGKKISNVWSDQMQVQKKRYVVETSDKAIERCLLMSTDPGDLVLDITCGSGTTAYAAEKLGRRWITCDTSRVALQLAKQRLLTSVFDYYKLAYPEQGVGSGFEYEQCETVSAKQLAEGTTERIFLYDRPVPERGKRRVVGPFTVEAVPSTYTKDLAEVIEGDNGAGGAAAARSGETLRQAEWRDQLLKQGVRGKSGQKLMFSRVELLTGAEHIHAVAETKWNDAGADHVSEDRPPPMGWKPQKVCVAFGPEYGSIDTRRVERAIKEAKHHDPDILLFCAFRFEPEAKLEISEMNPEMLGFNLLEAEMSTALLTSELRKGNAYDQNFWLLGSPDVAIHKQQDGKFRVEVRGFDYFNPKTSETESGGAQNIAMWLLDTSYDDRTLVPSQVFFPLANAQHGWGKLAKTLKADIDPGKIEQFKGVVSLPFEHKLGEIVAVKIVDTRGIEMLVRLKEDAFQNASTD